MTLIAAAREAGKRDGSYRGNLGELFIKLADALQAYEDALKAGEDATLPEDYQWGADALEAFNYGKSRTLSAIRAVKP